jgi:HEAT repeat protein
MKENPMKGLVVYGLAAFALLGVLSAPLAAQGQKEPRYRGKTAEQWLPRLAAEKTEERHTALYAVKALGAEARTAAVEVLVDMLEDRDWEFREFAASSLGELGPAADRAVSALIPLLGDEEPRVRTAVLWTLAALGPGAEEAIPALKTAFDNVDPKAEKADYFRWELITTLGKLGPKAAPVLMDLAEASGQELMQGHVAHALGEMGPQAKAVLPRLAKTLPGKGTNYQAVTAWAMWQIGKDPLALATVARVLEAHASDKTAKAAEGEYNDFLAPLQSAEAVCDFLAELGPEAKETTPALAKLLSHRQREIKIKAAWALWKIARRPESITVLGQCLLMPPSYFRYHNLRAEPPQHTIVDEELVEKLGAIGPEAKAALPALTNIQKGVKENHYSRERGDTDGRPSLDEVIDRAMRQIDPKRE